MQNHLRDSCLVSKLLCILFWWIQGPLGTKFKQYHVPPCSPRSLPLSHQEVESISTVIGLGQACDSFVRVECAHHLMWLLCVFTACWDTPFWSLELGCKQADALRPPCCEEAHTVRIPTKKGVLSQAQLLLLLARSAPATRWLRCRRKLSQNLMVKLFAEFSLTETLRNDRIVILLNL